MFLLGEEFHATRHLLSRCVLEIGIGHSLVRWNEEKTTADPSSLILGIPQLDKRKGVIETKRALVKISEEDLPLKIGRRFAKIAVTCLTCLDANNGFRAKSECLDENGVLVGVRFIEKAGSLIFLQKLLIYI